MSNKCECFKNMLNLAKQRVEPKLPEGATDFKVKWNDNSFFLGGDYSPVNPKVNISYRIKKKDGTPAKNLTKTDFSIVADFCCYCGRKLGKSDK